MVTFGSKAGANVRDRAQRAGDFIKNLQDGKDLNVRFLQDPEEWTEYREHYSPDTKFFPCTQDDACPGCNSDNEQTKRSSRRYATSVLDIKTAQVIALKLPIDLANRVIGKCDRNGGTLLDRDYTLIRTGKGMSDTTYDVDTGDRRHLDLGQYVLLDIEEMLAESFRFTFGEDPQSKPAKPVSASRQEQLKKSVLGITKTPKEDEEKPPF